MSSLRVLLLEPYASGSHGAWAEGYRRASSHDVQVFSLPGRFWKWRMHGAAVTLARRAGLDELIPDVVLASDMLDLAAFLGLTRRFLADVPIALYMHENQLSYPPLPVDSAWSDSRRRRAARRDEHYGFVNFTSTLAADVVLWNSAFNRDSFLERLPEFLRAFPDHQETDTAGVVRDRSRILPLGLDLAGLDDQRPAKREPGPPRIVWNHRWEHDKAPEEFFRALYALADDDVPFELIVLGESFVRTPDVFDEAKKRLGERMIHFGYADDRADYARWLWAGDLVVSTARHEFFGAAVCEAAYCECRPLLPNGLAYPELVPDDVRPLVLYEGREELDAVLRAALSRSSSDLVARMREAVARFDWQVMAPHYDELLEELATARSSERRG